MMMAGSRLHLSMWQVHP